MNPVTADMILELFLILLCMVLAYKWKREQMKHVHYKSMYEDKVDLLQTYKHLIDRNAKQTTRIQNELNKVDSMYHTVLKELKELKNNT